MNWIFNTIPSLSIQFLTGNHCKPYWKDWEGNSNDKGNIPHTVHFCQVPWKRKNHHWYGIFFPSADQKENSSANPYSLRKKKEWRYQRKTTDGNTLYDGIWENSNELSTVTAGIQPSQESAFGKDGKDHRRDKSWFHVEA